MMIKELLARHCGGVREVHDNQFGFLCSGVRFGKTLSLTTDQLGILEDTVADPSSSLLNYESVMVSKITSTLYFFLTVSVNNLKLSSVT